MRTVDAVKRDGAYELLLGCTADEMSIAERFHTSEYMARLLARRPGER